jgi:hypothetical protein
MSKGPKDWRPGGFTGAEKFEEAVRRAFIDVYGPPRDPSTLERSVLSSFLPDGKKLGWTRPDEGTVLVLTEFAWIGDPFSSQEHLMWEKVIKLLRSRGWPTAWWDSINPGVQVVFNS